MRILVVGAGASLAEAIALQVPEEFRPPLISNFAKKFWREFNPHPILDMFLESMGYQASDRDGRDLFYRLEKENRTDVEHFFAFAWHHRQKNWAPRRSGDPTNPDALPRDYIHGFVATSAGKNAISTGAGKPLLSWENLIYHGMGDPLQTLLIRGFFVNGRGWKPFGVGQRVAAKLRPGDVVVSLNYDPIFEIALKQASRPFEYVTNALRDSVISMCKPHGTINMIVSEDGTKAAFGEPENLGGLPSKGWRSFLGMIPPRFNKTYEEHYYSRTVVSVLASLNPQMVTFWGVGMTSSDADLCGLYRSWSRNAMVVEALNPDSAIAQKYRAILGVDVEHFTSHEAWLADGG